jgi:hypothetical protein
MQAEPSLGYRNQNLSAGSNPNAALELSAPRFEIATVLSQLLKPASGQKCCGLAGYHGNGASEKNKEPQEHPVPALKPHHRAGKFSV